MHAKNIHTCHLKKPDGSGFSKLPPNASDWTKFQRKIRTFLTINPHNWKTRAHFKKKSAIRAEQKKHATYPFVIHPFSSCNSVLETVFFIFWTVSYVFIPLTCIRGTIYKITWYPESYIMFPVQYLLVATFFFVGYVESKTHTIVNDPKQIILHYLKTYFFFDINAAGFSEHLLDILVEENEDDLTYDMHLAFVCLRVLRLVCCYARYPTIKTYMKGILRNFSPISVSIFMHFIETFLILHLLGCLTFYIPHAVYLKDIPSNAWLIKQFPNTSNNTQFFSVYSECLGRGACAFIGCSYGSWKFIARTPDDLLFASFVSVLGRLYTLYIIANILQIFKIASMPETHYERSLVHLQDFMSAKNLPANLRKRLVQFYEFKLQKRHFNEKQFMAELSEYLRTELYMFSAKRLVENSPILQILPKEILGAVLASMKSESYAPRDILHHIGSIVDKLYFISSGTLAVYNSDGKEMTHLTDGDEVGLTTMFLQNPRYTFKYVAIETTELFFIKHDLFFNLIRHEPNVLRFCEQRLKERLHLARKYEDIIRYGGHTVVSELKRHGILERTKIRPVVERH